MADLILQITQNEISRLTVIFRILSELFHVSVEVLVNTAARHLTVFTGNTKFKQEMYIVLFAGSPANSDSYLRKPLRLEALPNIDSIRNRRHRFNNLEFF